MSKARARYTEADIARVLKAAAKAHVDVRVRIDPSGNIVIVTGNLAEPNEANGHASEIATDGEWDNIQ
jgi:hypothetical protein